MRSKIFTHFFITFLAAFLMVLPGRTQTTVEVMLGSGTDDVEEFANQSSFEGYGHVDESSSDLELGRDGFSTDHPGAQIVAMYYASVGVPAGATITSAHIQFTCDHTSDGPLTLQIYAEAADNSSPLLTTDMNVSGRERTTSMVEWTPPDWLEADVDQAGDNQKTPDISSVIQEVVCRSGWSENNGMTLMLIPTDLSDAIGWREAEAYDGDNKGPVLHITWTAGGGCTSGVADMPLYRPLTVYPNPSSGFVNVMLEKSMDASSSLRITDVTGKVIATRNNLKGLGKVEFDLSGSPAGLYFGMLVSQDESYAFKILKK